MRKILLVCSLLSISMIALWTVSAATPNFSGKWQLDKKASTGLKGPMAQAEVTMNVKQDEKKLAVETKIDFPGRNPDLGAPGMGGGGFGGAGGGGGMGGGGPVAGGGGAGGGGGMGGGGGRQGGGGGGGERQGGQMGGGPQTIKHTYNLDGTESSEEMGKGGKVNLTAKWAGETKLDLTQVSTRNVQGNETTSTTTEEWELGEGGKTLTVIRSTMTPQGKQETKLVYKKK